MAICIRSLQLFNHHSEGVWGLLVLISRHAMVVFMAWFQPRKELPGFQALTLWASIGLHVLLAALFLKFAQNPMARLENHASSTKPDPIQWINLQDSQPKRVVDVVDTDSLTTQKVESNLLGEANRLVQKQTVAKGNDAPTSQPKPSTDASSSSKPTVDGLNLSDEALQKVLAQTASAPTPHTISFTPSNYLPDIEEGDQTQLSTQKFAYASFFNRMKRSIQGYWKPPIHTIANAPRKSNWVAQVLIVLDDQGAIVDMQVLQSSGAPTLDRFTLSAIQQAAPFPNPPSVLLNEYGEIRMTWNFIFSQTQRF